MTSARLLATLTNDTVEHYNDLFLEIKTVQATNALAADVKRRIVGAPIVDIPHWHGIDELGEDSSKEWKVTTRVLTYEGRIYVPKDDHLRHKVISVFHNNPESAHFGAHNMAEFVSLDSTGTQ